MPPVVAGIVLAFASIGSALAPAIFVPLFASAFGQVLIYSALASLGAKALGALMPRPDYGLSIERNALDNLTIRQPIEPWQIIYGKQRVRGTLTFFERAGTNKEFIHMVITFAGHQVTAFDEIWFDDVIVPLDGNGDATGTYAGFVHVEKSLGDPTFNGQPYPGLASALPSLWTSNHKQRGRAGIYVRIKLDPNKFPNGVPNIRAVIRGKPVYDTRTATTGYSDNPALIARDWAIWDVGKNIPAADIPDAEVNAAANVCDELVNLSPSGTQKKYTCNGAFRLGQANPDSVLLGILTSMVGDFVNVGGTWKMYAGAWRTPTAEIKPADFRDEISVTSLVSMSETFNAVKGLYVSPANNYQPTDFPPVTNATYETEDGGRVWQEIDLPFTNDSNMARRIAKILLEDHRRMTRVTLPLKMTQFNVTALDNVEVTFPEFSWSKKTFRVNVSRLASEQDRRRSRFGVDLEGKETDAGIFDWSSGEQVDPGGTSSNDPGDLKTVAAVTNLTLTSGSTVAVTGADGVKRNRIKATWTAPADQLVTSGGAIIVEYKKNADSIWIALAALPGSATEAYIENVIDGTAYDVRVTAENIAGARSATVSVTNHTVSGVTSDYTGDIEGDPATDVQDGAERARETIQDAAAAFLVKGPKYHASAYRRDTSQQYQGTNTTVNGTFIETANYTVRVPAGTSQYRVYLEGTILAGTGTAGRVRGKVTTSGGTTTGPEHNVNFSGSDLLSFTTLTVAETITIRVEVAMDAGTNGPQIRGRLTQLEYVDQRDDHLT